MKKYLNVIERIAFFTLIAVFSIGCSTDNENDNPGGEQALTKADLKTILEADKIAGVADDVLAEIYAGDPSSAKEVPCYETAYTETGYTATFNNCVLNGTENVNGILTVEYASGTQAAAFTATFTDFYVGENKVNGTRAYSISSNSTENAIEFTVVSDLEVTLADQSVLSENGTKTVVFTFGDTLETSTFAIGGNWTVEVDGNTYAVEVTDTLVGNLGCANLVSGNMIVSKNGLAVTVDFGEGSCDAMATIIYPNEATEEVNLNN
jgi:hypothetical protein